MKARTNDDGFSLVEVLVAIMLFGVLSVGFYQVMIAQARTADTTRSISRMADEARLGFNRMVREVREADNITYVSDDERRFTIQINYNNDAFYTTAADEILTFTYDDAAKTVTMCSALTHTACTASNTAVLMAGVDEINDQPVFAFAGNNLEWDWYGPGGTGPPDGVVTWREIDEASDVTTHNVVGVGNNDNDLDEGEYPYLGTVKFALQATDGGRATHFFATAQMRNKTW